MAIAPPVDGDDDDDLFDWGESRSGQQQENLDRVKARIGWAIRDFYRDCEASGTLLFRADDLRNYVRARVGEVAPGSPDRVMRDMRQKGEINYRVVSRSESLYEITHDPPGLDIEID